VLSFEWPQTLQALWAFEVTLAHFDVILLAFDLIAILMLSVA